SSPGRTRTFTCAPGRRDRDQTLGVLVDSTFLSKNPGKVLRESRTISTSSGNVKQCLWFAVQEYNKESKEKSSSRWSRCCRSRCEPNVHLSGGHTPVAQRFHRDEE
ncbi:hypothetical protein EI555_007007, partial [Monodon monoceros]